MTRVASLVPVLGGAALTVAVCYALGRLVGRAIGFKGATLSNVERGILRFGLGSACLSTLVFFLCVLQLAYPATFVLVAAAVFGAYWRWGRGARPTLSSIRLRDYLSKPGLWPYLLILGVYLGVYLIYALAPEISFDAVVYHLGLVRQFARNHGFSYITDTIYAFLPLGTEMLYLFAYSFGLHSAAKLIHLTFAVLTVAGIAAFGARVASKRVGLFAAAIYLCAPVVGLDASSAYNDCALAFFVFAAFVALFLWRREPSRPNLIVFGVLAGFCFAIKYTAGIPLVAAAVVVVASTWRRTGRPRGAMVDALTFVGVASVLILPWIVKNLVVTGNPLAPFFNTWFPNPYVTPTWEAHYLHEQRHLSGFGAEGWRDYLTAPLELTLWGGRTTSIVGVAFLAVPFAALAWRSAYLRAVLLAAAIVGLPWFANVSTRFLIPALPFAALACAFGLDRLPRRAGAAAALGVALVHAFLAYPDDIQLRYPKAPWILLPPVPVQQALGLASPEDYLAYRMPLYPVARRIDAVSRPGDRVLSLEALPEAYMDTPVVVSYHGAAGERLFRALLAPTDRAFWPAKLLKIPIDRQPITGFRISPTSSHDSREWGLFEISFWNDGRQIAPSSDWTATTSYLPWNASYLIDSEPMTSWNTAGAPFRPDLHAEVSFPEPLLVDEVQIVQSPYQDEAAPSYLLRTAANEWMEAGTEDEWEETGVDEAAMKRWPAVWLRRRGVTLLLVDTSAQGFNYIAPRIIDDPGAWGFREVFREGTRRLYRIDR